MSTILDPTDVDPKGPGESKIYTMDWSGYLNDGATISVSSWNVSTGLTRAADSIVAGNTKTSVRVSGGTLDMDYRATNIITTSDGESLERTGIIRVRTI